MKKIRSLSTRFPGPMRWGSDVVSLPWSPTKGVGQLKE